MFEQAKRNIHTEEGMFQFKTTKNFLRLTPKGQKDGTEEYLLVDVSKVVLVEPIAECKLDRKGSKITLDILGEKREYEVDEDTSIISKAIEAIASKESS